MMNTKGRQDIENAVYSSNRGGSIKKTVVRKYVIAVVTLLDWFRSKNQSQLALAIFPALCEIYKQLPGILIGSVRGLLLF